MNAPAAISGTFTKMDAIAGRKVVRLHIECNIEEADAILNALGGYPDPANPAHVAVARLNIPVAQARAAGSKQPDKRKLTELPAPQQAALTCQREAFWRYIREQNKSAKCISEEDAAYHVRTFCKVDSRSELATNEVARQRWNLLLSGFQAWLEVA
jgi:hypothetical protein